MALSTKLYSNLASLQITFKSAAPYANKEYVYILLLNE